VSDNVTLDIPIDEARQLLKQYPNFCYLSEAVAKWDEEHKPPTVKRFLGTVTDEELEVLRKEWKATSNYTHPAFVLIQRLVHGEVEEVVEVDLTPFTMPNSARWNALPKGIEFAVNHPDLRADTPRFKEDDKCYYQAPAPGGDGAGFCTIGALTGATIIPLDRYRQV
jgi:hypothetical protein